MADSVQPSCPNESSLDARKRCKLRFIGPLVNGDLIGRKHETQLDTAVDKINAIRRKGERDHRNGVSTQHGGEGYGPCDGRLEVSLGAMTGQQIGFNADQLWPQLGAICLSHSFSKSVSNQINLWANPVATGGRRHGGRQTVLSDGNGGDSGASLSSVDTLCMKIKWTQCVVIYHA